MASKQTCTCDFCQGVIQVGEGGIPNRLMLEPAHGPEIGSAYDAKDMCGVCKERLYDLFPILREAERLVQPVPVPEPKPATPAELDTVSPEHLLVLLAAKLGVKVEKTDK